MQNNQMLSWVKADLFLGTAAVTALIAWGPVEGSDPVLPTQEVDELVVHLDNLPVADVHEILGQPPDQPFAPDAFSFPVQYEVMVLPHVRMEITGVGGQATALTDLLNTARNRWNAHDEGLIHSISEVVEDSPGNYSLTIDLRSAVEDGLEALLRGLDRGPVQVNDVLLRAI
ncbi:MAG: hypothetical protein AAF998_24895 [Bacteroidota bacterium]